ncbi:molybdenum cofactor guanylyltransferase [Jatrophihabitans sp.]|uniref:molybdenum cofactor guanylyltransferase n=1 Tax=Jatrophihabitans sp. TaxID=1932789 RepID=UPI0030C6C382|nr:molybdenum cofactor guanylyltransferase [Jatrophihabitans sp.]
MPSSSAEPFDAVVLAGARSERLGGVDKAMVEVGGRALLDRVLDGLAEAARVVVVGPQRPVPSRTPPPRWCAEEPSGGGPVAAFAAGLGETVAGKVVLLAADLPFVAAAVPALVSALGDGADVAMLVDDRGRANFLAGAWRRSSVLARLAELGPPAGQSMRHLLAGLEVTPVNDPDNWGFDCDTWDAVETARTLAADRPTDRPKGPHA